MRARVLVIACGLAGCWSLAAGAVEILKKEPKAGSMRPGEVVYVDDGKCPKGQVAKITAGAYSGSGRTQRGVAQARPRECVPRPT